MELSANIILELAELRMKIAALTKQEKKLAKNIKKEMAAQRLDEFAPSTSPYKFLYIKSNRVTVKWKEEWQRVAKKLYGKLWEVHEEKILEETKPVKTLRIEPNENYKEK
jgi:hypothetical protein